MNQQSIIEMTAKKHVKIYLLSQRGLKNREIADLLGTNAGHVYNALKLYRDQPDRVKYAEELSGQSL